MSKRRPGVGRAGAMSGDNRLSSNRRFETLHCEYLPDTPGERSLDV